MYNILICDDERDIVSALKIYLGSENHKIFESYNGREALDILENNEIHLVLLDIMMPVLDGISTLSYLREKCNVPVILLSAKSEDTDKILGLNIGADDYITKPFAIREVLARVKAVIRRTTTVATPTETIENKGKKEEKLTYETLVLNMELKLVTIDGQPVSLTKKELEILALLLSHPKHVFSRDEILEKIWEDDVLVLDRTVDVNITRLRKKIGEYGKRIITRQGYGYCFNP